MGKVQESPSPVIVEPHQDVDDVAVHLQELLQVERLAAPRPPPMAKPREAHHRRKKRAFAVRGKASIAMPA